MLDLALKCMRDHLLHVSTGGKSGRYLEPHSLRGVTACIRSLRAGMAKGAAGRKNLVAEVKWKYLMIEAAKYPELAEAIATM